MQAMQHVHAASVVRLSCTFLFCSTTGSDVQHMLRRLWDLGVWLRSSCQPEASLTIKVKSGFFFKQIFLQYAAAANQKPASRSR